MEIRATYPNQLKWLLVISGSVLVPLCSHGGDNMECNIGSVTNFYLDDTRVIRTSMPQFVAPRKSLFEC
ncbi:hypothetical protein EAE96_005377 [Botrytis aclada]|nr:hypothetical protein EAE96_005377 [Botrytis aclada]